MLFAQNLASDLKSFWVVKSQLVGMVGLRWLSEAFSRGMVCVLLSWTISATNEIPDRLEVRSE